MSISRNLVSGIVFAVVGLTLAWSSANATTYKWVDDNGNVTYSQRPPPEREATIIKPPRKFDSSAARTAANNRREAYSERRSSTESRKQDRIVDRTNAGIKQKNCAIARANLKKLDTRYMGVRQTDGSITRMTRDDQKSMRKKFNEQMRKNCA